MMTEQEKQAISDAAKRLRESMQRTDALLQKMKDAVKHR
jgi:hypothetical protein